MTCLCNRVSPVKIPVLTANGESRNMAQPRSHVVKAAAQPPKLRAGDEKAEPGMSWV